jgi:tRNA A-37 threonylcarbamoyl transferase component Bud32
MRFALFSGIVPAISLFALRRIRGTGFSADTLVWPGRMVVKLYNPLLLRTHVAVYGEQSDKTALVRDVIQGRFAREFGMLRRLAEIELAPNPIAHGPYYLAMEHVDASPLYKCLDDRPHLARCVVEAVERMHEAGLHHGDLTMGNILADRHDRIYLIDFETEFAPFVPAEERDTLDYVFFLRRLHQRHPGLAARHGARFCREILDVHPAFVSKTAKCAALVTGKIAADIREAEMNRCRTKDDAAW